MRIRKATLKDWTVFLEIYHLVSNNHKHLLKEQSEIVELSKDYKKHLKKEFLSYVKSKNHVLFLAEEHNQVMGLIAGSIHQYPRYYKVNTEGYIENLFVLKEFRGQGVSTKLRDELFKWFKEKKIKDLGLEVFDNNIHAQNIYLKWGFKFFNRKMKLKLK